MLLAKLKADGKFYAVKVLQKKVILKKKEVCVHVVRFVGLDGVHTLQSREGKINPIESNPNLSFVPTFTASHRGLFTAANTFIK